MPNATAGRSRTQPPPNGRVPYGMSALPELPPPHSLDAEQAVLGAALISRTALERVLQMLDRGDFYLEAHRKLFDVFAYLAERNAPVDELTVTEELRRRDELDRIGGIAYINRVAESVPTAAHVEYYARIVLSKATLRQLIAEANTAILQAHEQADDDPDGVIAKTLQRVEQIQQRHAPKGRAILTAPELLSLDLPPPKWAVPGLLPEGLTLLQAKPKIGKSWMAYQIAIAVASGGVALGSVPVEQGQVLCLMLEDTKRRAKSRILKLLGESLPPDGMHLALEWPRMDQGGRSALDAWLREHPQTRLVVIDTLERFRAGRNDKTSAYADDYGALCDIKAIADRHGVSFLIIHHERKSQGKSTKREDIQDRTSGSYGITGAADGTLSLERERGQKGAVLELTGRDVEEEKLAVVFDIHAGGWTLHGKASEFFQSEAEQRVVDLLWSHQGKSLTPSEVAAILNQNRQTIKSQMWRMAEKGLLLTSDGAYSLAPRVIAQFHATAATGETACNRATSNHPEEPSDQESLFETAPGCEVAPVSEVAAVAAVARNGPVSEPEDPDDLRATVLRQAQSRGFPALEVPGSFRVQSGAQAWSALYRRATEEQLMVALQALVREPGGSDG